jgi:hypothetical protein
MPTLSSVALRANLNPARGWLWEMKVPSSPGGDRAVWTIRCRSTSKPSRGFGKIVVPFRGTGGVSYPGKEVYTHTLPVTFNESEDRGSHAELYAWSQLIQNTLSGVGVGDALIKRNVDLQMINKDGAVAETYKIWGCYLENIQEVPLQQDSDTHIIISATLSFDFWTLDTGLSILGVAQAALAAGSSLIS